MATAKDRFLVCGLGSLGQHCARILRQFGVHVSAVDINPPRLWDVDAVPELLTSLTIGDCRDPELLAQCHLHQVRCILLVTGDERVNIEAGFAARSKNPNIRLVIRSTKQKLNKLLSEQLPNSIAIEPTEITSTSFALAALGDETRGSFYLHGRLVQVLDREVQKDDPWLFQRVETVHKQQRVLAHTENAIAAPERFYQWHPEAKIQEGDRLLYLHFPHEKKTLQNRPSKRAGGNRTDAAQKPLRSRPALSRKRIRISQLFANLTHRLMTPLWHHRWLRLVLFCFSSAMLLLGVGGFLFYLYGPGLNVTDSVYAAVILMLGGYVDLLGSELEFNLAIPWWLRLFGLLQTLAGTVLIGALYALITSHLLAVRFHFSKKAQHPEADHVVVIGWGRIGQKITRLLSAFRQPFVVITKDNPRVPSHLPIIRGVEDTARVLSDVHLETAKGIISVTNDEMTNLELGLTAHSMNPSCRVVLRTYHHRFGQAIKEFFPYAHVLSSSALSAEAFSAAAFGEHIIALFIQNGQTILVTQYQVEENDTLNGRILATVAHGYGVVPVVLLQGRTNTPIWMPSASFRLAIGDELTVLATMDGLRRIEAGQLRTPSHQLVVQRVTSDWAKSEGVIAITKATDCTLVEARELLENLPGALPTLLYLHQGHQLVKRLHRLGFVTELVGRSAGEGTAAGSFVGDVTVQMR